MGTQAEPLTTAETGVVGRARTGAPGYYAVAPQRLVIFSIVSFGLYELYWFYRQWDAIREHRRPFESLSPFWRSWFAIFFVGSLANRIRDDCEIRGVRVSYRSTAVAAVFIVLWICVRLPDPYWLLALLTPIPLVPVQDAINTLHTEVGHETVVRWRPCGWEWGFLIVGGLWLSLVLFGMIAPEPVSTDAPAGLAMLPPN